jgi:hypothetical protein
MAMAFLSGPSAPGTCIDRYISAELWLGYASSSQFFQSEGFEGAARQVIRDGHASRQFIRDLKGDFHKSTLTGG